MKKHNGFTLIELMVTLVVVGVLLMVGVPSLKTFLQGSEQVAASNDLLSALHVARSEAIKLNSRVSICATDGGTTCVGDDWSKGWVVFVDGAGLVPGDLKYTDPACTAVGTDCLLRIHTGFTGKQLLLSGVDANNTPVSSVTFTSRGLPKTVAGGSQTGNFSVCSFNNEGTVMRSRTVILSLSGRVRISDSDDPEVNKCPASI